MSRSVLKARLAGRAELILNTLSPCQTGVTPGVGCTVEGASVYCFTQNLTFVLAKGSIQKVIENVTVAQQ
jgi:hypothetical protein